MPAQKINKFKLHRIHFQAGLVLVLYLIVSKTVFFGALTHQNIFISFLAPLIFGSLAGLVFLYLFGHENFFPFAREIEREEKKDEKKWQKIFSHHGKSFISIAIGIIGGPILGALAIRLLIHKRNFWRKYLLILISEIISTFFYIGVLKGLSGVI
jgi:cytochrome c biogenesis protein CcdA